MTRRHAPWAVLVALFVPHTAAALDPPHASARSIQCVTCHTLHDSPGGVLTTVAGNFNLCQTCHVIGGQADAFPFIDADQALPGPGLPASESPAGTSHRWDSGPAGHAEPAASNTSTGTVRSGGTFVGVYAKTYTLTITTAGDVGTAQFSWTDTLGASGSGTTGRNVILDEGVDASFFDGSASPAFELNDVWNVYVRTDLNDPTASALSRRLENGKIMCSTCHQKHDQVATPFDPAAPIYGGPGTGEGRHHQRIDNDQDQMCVDCHSARDVPDADQGSHAVAVVVPTVGPYQPPPTLPLDASGLVRCMTCHKPHFTPSSDGSLTRIADNQTLCIECHTLADSVTPASHLDATNASTLWPGGQYGSTFPAITDSGRQGACGNCHTPHGWPDDSDTTQDFSKLRVERYDDASDGTDPDDAEDLCFTCHDADGPAVNDLSGELAKGVNTSTQIYHHPVVDSEQPAGRSIECIDCHDPHQATDTKPLMGATGIDLGGAPVGPGDVQEYEVCLKCHGDTYVAGRDIDGDGNADTSNKRLDFASNASAYHPVQQAGRNQSGALSEQLEGGLTTSSVIQCTDCHNNEQTNDAQGEAENSSATPQGVHGSTIFPILRDQSELDSLPTAQPPASVFGLCWLCHSQTKLYDTQQFDDGARTNFYNGRRDNLHWFHLNDFGDVSCRSCHYNTHGDQSAPNTIYRVEDNGTELYEGTTPPDGYKTRNVNFAPQVSGNSDTNPIWQVDITTRDRTCDLVCHGETHVLNDRDYTYNAEDAHGDPNQDDDALTY